MVNPEAAGHVSYHSKLCIIALIINYPVLWTSFSPALLRTSWLKPQPYYIKFRLKWDGNGWMTRDGENEGMKKGWREGRRCDLTYPLGTLLGMQRLPHYMQKVTERKNEWNRDGEKEWMKGRERKKEVWPNISTGHHTGIVEAVTLHALGDREKDWMKQGWRESINEKGMERRKEMWLTISAGHPTGIVEATTLHALGDGEKEWVNRDR